MRTFRTEFEIENLWKNDIHVLAQEEVQFERKASFFCEEFNFAR